MNAASLSSVRIPQKYYLTLLVKCGSDHTTVSESTRPTSIATQIIDEHQTPPAYASTQIVAVVGPFSSCTQASAFRRLWTDSCRGVTTKIANLDVLTTHFRPTLGAVGYVDPEAVGFQAQPSTKRTSLARSHLRTKQTLSSNK